MNPLDSFKASQVVEIASSWSNQALKDGKVTLKEAIDLAERVCNVLDVPLDLSIPETKTEEE